MIFFQRIKYSVLVLLISSFFFSCADRQEKQGTEIVSGMNLVWSDEFDYEGAPDPEKWDYSVGGHGWGNGEIQKYTNSRDNSYVKDGVLCISAKNEGGLWTSARLKTQYKGSWTYGYIEVRAKLPKGRGTWPAIWMMPEFDKYGGWPRSGEIDIMEHVGYEQDVIHTTVHTASFNHKKNTQKTRYAPVKNVSKKFHTYAVYWTPSSIEWLVDGETFFTFENSGNGIPEWPFDHPFYLILNVAIGGSWGGQQGIDEKLKSAEMLVDYVRVYQDKQK